MNTQNKIIACQSIYNLTLNSLNPIFEGFAFETHPLDQPSLLGRENFQQDITPGYSAKGVPKPFEWSPTLLKEVWPKPRVVGRVVPFNDFPFNGSNRPIFSEKACLALGDMLKFNGELLPLKTEIGNYYFYNVTTVANVLDFDRSVFRCWPDSQRAMFVSHFVFHPDKLDGLSIFRLQGCTSGVFVTDEFVRRIHESQLNGYRLRKVWPLSRDIRWEAIDKTEDTMKELRKLYQNTLVILLSIGKEEIDEIEKELLAPIEDDLDELLTLENIESKYYGTYSNSETIDGQYRMFISCPDVESLINRISDWLKSLYYKWDGDIYIMKRFGYMHDPDAKEERIKYKG